MPEETREVLRRAPGKVLTVRDPRDEPGDVELWMRNGRDRRRIVGADIIWVEPELPDVVTAAAADADTRRSHQEHGKLT
jgi:hypothetical protein